MTYIIGEIGQNHNGSMDIAKLIIDIAARPVEGFPELKRMNAVKFTKRDLEEELTATMMAAPYNSPNSFGATYGEHRAILEFSDEQHLELYEYTKAKGLDFVITLCSVGCLSVLKLFTPDKLKVASRDLTNLPLLDAMAATKIPMIISTGMAGEKEIDDALAVITEHHQDVSILHCLSQYPTDVDKINLKSITYLQKRYPDYNVGYSDHSIGIMIPVAAVAMGAEIIEKHITLDRQMKGSDQAGSLGIDGIWRMVRDIRLLELALGEERVFISEGVTAAKHKLERSIASRRAIRKGETISEADIHMLSPGTGLRWVEREKVLGKVALEDIPANELITAKQVK